MKSHRTLEQCFTHSGLPESNRNAFEQGWYACASEINNGVDGDWLQEDLYANGFLLKADEDEC
jgi:hypothetical protein